MNIVRNPRKVSVIIYKVRPPDPETSEPPKAGELQQSPETRPEPSVGGMSYHNCKEPPLGSGFRVFGVYGV